MQFPASFIQSIANATGFDRQAFEEVHLSGEQVTSIRLNPLKPAAIFPNFPISNSKIPWSESGYYLPERPSFTFDPLFHAGCYYVQEASSMFLEQVLRQTTDLSKPLRVLDLCAAPGGKSTHLQSLLSAASLLVSNEVIRSRAGILRENIIKWGAGNVVVTQNDPAEFNRLTGYFDVIVADAPCSGSGLFRREPGAIEEWSESNVQLCSRRQQRILADIWPALKKGGVLIYSTCSYSREEDEAIAEWMLREFQVEPAHLAIEPSWGIIQTGNGYRFWPDKVKGEGFFIAAFRKKEEEAETESRPGKNIGRVSKKEMEVLEKWVNPDGISLVKHLQTVYAWPDHHVNDLQFILGQLKVIYSGVLVGELLRDKLIPDHALAMSGIRTESIRSAALDLPQAIRYLQRKEFSVEGLEKGWQLVSFQEHALGWINALGNRINNYYPRELRILKDN